MAQMRQGVLFRWRDEFATWLKPEWVELILRCVKGGLADFDDHDWIPPHVRLLLSPRSEASIRHDFIVARFESELVGMPELRMRRRDMHVLIWVADEAVATIKKLGEKTLLAMPNKTRSSHNILSDEPTLLEGMPPEAQQVIIGYTVDASNTQYKYYIACPSKVGRDHHWIINLSDAADLVVFAAPEADAPVEVADVDEQSGRVQLNEDVAKQVEEIEEAEEDEEGRRGTDDSAR